MGFLTNDGLHEGYVVPQFADGELAIGSSVGTVPADQVVSGQPFENVDGRWVWPTRPASEVAGWVVCCDCSTGYGSSRTTWTGPVIARVPLASEEDLPSLLLYANDDDVNDASSREDVESLVHRLWRAEHTNSHIALAAVRAASNEVETAQDRLSSAIANARSAGAGWAEVSVAARMSEKTAEERWRTSSAFGMRSAQLE